MSKEFDKDWKDCQQAERFNFGLETYNILISRLSLNIWI